MQANEQAIRQVVEEVLAQLGKRGRGPTSSQPKSGDWGVFPTVDQAADAAEACFRRAIDVAARQQAKPWELRAATSMARLWHAGSRSTEAHCLLSGIYDWFTEGFDLPALRDARALLAQLDRPR